MKKNKTQNIKPRIQVPKELYSISAAEKSTIVHCAFHTPEDESLYIRADRTLMLVALPTLRCYRLISSYNIPMEGKNPERKLLPAGSAIRFTLVFEGFDPEVTSFFIYEPEAEKGFQCDFTDRNATDVYEITLHNYA